MTSVLKESDAKPFFFLEQNKKPISNPFLISKYANFFLNFGSTMNKIPLLQKMLYICLSLVFVFLVCDSF